LFSYLSGIPALFDEGGSGGKAPATGGKGVGDRAPSDIQDFSIKQSIFRSKFSLYNDTLMRASRT